VLCGSGSLHRERYSGVRKERRLRAGMLKVQTVIWSGKERAFGGRGREC